MNELESLRFEGDFVDVVCSKSGRTALKLDLYSSCFDFERSSPCNHNFRLRVIHPDEFDRHFVKSDKIVQYMSEAELI